MAVVSLVMCLICEKQAKEFERMEFDFAICKKCFEQIYPYLVKQKVLGNESSMLMEARYYGRIEY